MSNKINKSYPLAALLINATNQEVTKERIEAIFSTLNLEFSSKIASMFCLSAQKYRDIMSSIGSSSSAAPNVCGSSTAAATAEEEAPEEESSSDDMVLDF